MKTPEEYAVDQRRFRKLLASYGPEVVPEGSNLEVSCGIGWYDLLQAFLDEAAEAARQTRTRIIITQVKQKFAGLRIYYQCSADQQAATQAVEQAAQAAERASLSVCEVCGDAAQVRDHGGWVVTLCDVHWRKYKQRSSAGSDV